MEGNNDPFIQKLHTHLFDSKNEIPVIFDQREQEMLSRYRAAFTKWLAEPHLRDVQMVNFLVSEFDVSEMTAYRDISRIKILVGNVKNASREFQRYRASEMILRGYETAANASTVFEVKQAISMIRAGEALVRVHRLDRDDFDAIPYDQIVPLELQPSPDVTVVGHKPVENLEELKAKLRKKYGSPVIDVMAMDESGDE